MTTSSKLHEIAVVRQSETEVTRQNCTMIDAGIAIAVARAKLVKVMGSDMDSS
jgi:hypothetical protein